MKLFLSIATLLILITGCSHKMTYVDFQNGNVLEGHYVDYVKDIEVTMPNGEVLKGKFSNISNNSFSFGNSFSSGTATNGTTTVFGNANSFGTGYSVGGAGKAYALLKSETTNLMMEVVVNYDSWSRSGFGEARTNDGRKYKVQF